LIRTLYSSAKGFAWLAFGVGIVHAGFSVYWAVGGHWLLGTVGQWAVRLSEESPLYTGLVLGLVAGLKLGGATVPVCLSYGRVRSTKFWRILLGTGGALLTLYGGVNVVVSNAVLAGVIHSGDGYDLDAMRGHAFLWDPLFLVWGLSLLAFLYASRERPSRGPSI